MSDDLPELTSEQIAAFNRAAATLRDEDFSPEDMTAIRRGWLGLVKEKAYSHPGWHYEMPEIRGQPPRGSVKIPRDIFAALGHGDMKVGGAIVAAMFSVGPGDDVTIIGPDVIRDLGHGSERAGRRVLDRFFAQVRRDAAPIPQPDGHHGVVRRAR